MLLAATVEQSASEVELNKLVEVGLDRLVNMSRGITKLPIAACWTIRLKKYLKNIVYKLHHHFNHCWTFKEDKDTPMKYFFFLSVLPFYLSNMRKLSTR